LLGVSRLYPQTFYGASHLGDLRTETIQSLLMAANQFLEPVVVTVSPRCSPRPDWAARSWSAPRPAFASWPSGSAFGHRIASLKWLYARGGV